MERGGCLDKVDCRKVFWIEYSCVEASCVEASCVEAFCREASCREISLMEPLWRTAPCLEEGSLRRETL